MDTRADRHPHVKADPQGNYVFRNQHLVALVEKRAAGFGSVTIYRASGPLELRNQVLAVAPSLAQLVTGPAGSAQSATFMPDSSRLSGDDTLVLRGKIDQGGVSWDMEAELRISDDPWLSWEVRARPASAASLVRLVAMPLRAGEAGPREAIFPGLEYLEGEEGSSSQAADRSEAARRLVPHPDKITVPLMAHSQGGSTVALMWDNRQEWGGPGMPAALFDSPNRTEAQPGTRMEIFLPSVPGNVKENEELAFQPLPVPAGRELRLSGKILVLRDDPDPAHAVRQWLRAFVQPREKYFGRRTRDVASFHREFSAERRLSRPALDRASDDATLRGWQSTVRGADPAATPETFRTLAAWMEAELGEGKEARAARAEAEKRISDQRKAVPLDPRLAYRFGGVLSSLDAQRTWLARLIDLQAASGSWPWQPAGPEQATLGSGDEVEVGTVTAAALPLLRFAALTGDTPATGAGIRALEFLSLRYRVPRGGQPWELPLSAPDLAAATQAAECFLLGYQVTGERRYLESARYWADTGLPFIYLWSDRDRPAVLGASIPAFGASQFQQSWYGRPAQWTGLAYARVLQKLRRELADETYATVADAILASAMRQQVASGEGAGTLPESWNLRESRGEGARLSPEPLLTVLYQRLGVDPDVSHARVRVGADRMFVASGARIIRTDTSAMRLRMDLHGIEGTETFTTITGVLSRPLRVEYNTPGLRDRGLPVSQRFLPEVSDESQRGWFYDPDSQLLILRLAHGSGEDHLEIRWDDPRLRYPLERIPEAEIRRKP